MRQVVYPIIASVGFFAILFLYLSGLGYQREVFELGQAFTLMRYAAYAGIASLALVIFYILWQRPQGIRLLVIFVSALCGLTAFFLPYQQQQRVQQLPLIHDITTDTINPPAFVAVVPLRANAPNPVSYAGEEIAVQQREAYPDVRTVVYVQDRQEVFAAARQLVLDLGWELVDANLEEGRIEATATTRWFGFRDDVVIRLQTGAADSTVFDMRSKSRIGRSDVGVNAARIRLFVSELNRRLDTGS